MNAEEQRIAIAEACGIDLGHHWSRGHCETCFVDEREADSVLCEDVIIPNYLSDLNAMHEAEKVIYDRGVGQYYAENLRQLAGINTYHSTASQRAEAFLRTIGRWKGTK